MKFEEFDSVLTDMDPRVFEVESIREEMTQAVKSLSTIDWKTIAKTWGSKSERWQINFILAAEYSCKESENIIVQMLQSVHKKVAMEAINSLFDAGCGAWVPNDQEVLELKKLLAIPYYCYHKEEELNGLIARSGKL